MIRRQLPSTNILLEVSDMNRNRQQTFTQAATAHRENLQKNLQRRMEAARDRGDENLLKMLEAEANYLK